MKKLNNKGFTLVELLAVLVILIAITSIAIPSISAALERNKARQDADRIKVLENAAQLYVSDNRQRINNSLSEEKKFCKIKLETLKQNGYLDEEAIKDSNEKEFDKVILYDFTEKTYTYCKNASDCNGVDLKELKECGENE